MLTGFTENLPSDVVLDTGIVMRDIAGVPTVIGVTVGGIKFDPGKEVRNVEFDNKRSGIAGLDRITMWKPTLAFTMIEVGGEDTGDQIDLIEQGSTTEQTGHPSSGEGSILTTTPKVAGSFFEEGTDYADNFQLVLERGGGGYAAVRFPIAFCSKYDLSTQDKNEGKISAEFEGRLSQEDAVSDPGMAPYVIELREFLPS